MCYRDENWMNASICFIQNNTQREQTDNQRKNLNNLFTIILRAALIITHAFSCIPPFLLLFLCFGHRFPFSRSQEFNEPVMFVLRKHTVFTQKKDEEGKTTTEWDDRRGGQVT
jgi:hypothetical protein